VEGVSGLLTARLYEFGVASLFFRVHLGERLPWEAFVEKALAMPELPFWEGFFMAELAALEPYLQGALLRPEEKRLSEEFAVYHALGLEGAKAHAPPRGPHPLVDGDPGGVRPRGAPGDGALPLQLLHRGPGPFGL